MDLQDGVPSDVQTSTLLAHAHRLDHNPSKLPAFRFVDRNRLHLSVVPAPSLLSPEPESAAVSTLNATTQGATSPQRAEQPPILTTTTTPLTPSSPAKATSTSPGKPVTLPNGSSIDRTPTKSTLHELPKPQERRLRRAPASHSSRPYGIETSSGPPPARSTQRPSTADQRPQNNSTTEWALAQQKLTLQTLKSPHATPLEEKSTVTKPRSKGASKSLDERVLSRPLIPPIRSFRSSTSRTLLEMNGRSVPTFGQAEDQEGDRDRTLRALEGLSDETQTAQTVPRSMDVDEALTDTATEDVFLNLARDDSARNNGEPGSSNGAEQRRVRLLFFISKSVTSSFVWTSILQINALILLHESVPN